jgi:hypothetical protein
MLMSTRFSLAKLINRLFFKEGGEGIGDGVGLGLAGLSS